MLKLPPLNALRYFESAARTGSYVQTANELHVSAAAVSQQIKNLEAFFGKQLFLRRNNSIVLSDAGTTLYQELAPTLRQLSDTTLQILGQQVPANMVVSCLPSLANNWLLHRLQAFAEEYPNIGIQLRVEDDPVNYSQHRFDLRIAYDRHFYNDLRQRPLFKDEVTPMCSPDFAARWQLRGAAEELARLPDNLFIHINWGEQFAALPSWSDWFRHSARQHNPELAKGMQVNMTSVALNMATASAGVVLGQRHLAARHIANGELIELSEIRVPLAHHYYAVTPFAQDGSRNLAALMGAITCNLQSD